MTMPFGAGGITLTADYIGRGLDGRKFGAHWMCRCPAHKDKGPSLSITERDGRVLVHCFGGCEQDSVIRALRDLGLWPEDRTWTQTERREYGRRRHQAEDLADIVRYWRASLVAQLEHEHLAALEAKDWLAWAQIGRELYRVRKASGADLIRQYTTARDTDPVETARLVTIGQDDEAHALAITAVMVAILARAEEGQRRAA